MVVVVIGGIVVVFNRSLSFMTAVISVGEHLLLLFMLCLCCLNLLYSPINDSDPIKWSIQKLVINLDLYPWIVFLLGLSAGS